MASVRLTIANYRCFGESPPLVLDLNGGCTALVGPNNAGKSTALKFFFELRPLFEMLKNPDQLGALLQGQELVCNFQGVEDPTAVYCSRTQQDLRLEILLPEAPENALHRLVATFPRGKPGRVRVSGHVSPFDDPIVEIVGSIHPGTVTNGRHKSGRNTKFTNTAAFEVFRDLHSAMFVPPFRNVIVEGTATHYDLPTGLTFVRKWQDWKTGVPTSYNHVIQDITSQIAAIFGVSRLEINATSDGRDLQVVVERQSFRLRELGSGLAQFIVTLGSIAIQRPKILLIDEPELHLHPSLQLSFLQALQSLGVEHMLFATHSLGLARTGATTAWSCTQKAGLAQIEELGSPQSYVELLGELSYSGYQGLGLKGVLLAEGINDVKTAWSMLRLFGKDGDYVVLPLGGDQFLPKERFGEFLELKRLAGNVAVLIDSDSPTGVDGLAPRRREFVESCRLNEINVHVTERTCIEGYLPQEALRRAGYENAIQVGPREAHDEQRHRWPKKEGWRALNHVTRSELATTDLGRWLESL